MVTYCEKCAKALVAVKKLDGKNPSWRTKQYSRFFQTPEWETVKKDYDIFNEGLEKRIAFAKLKSEWKDVERSLEQYARMVDQAFIPLKRTIRLQDTSGYPYMLDEYIEKRELFELNFKDFIEIPVKKLEKRLKARAIQVQKQRSTRARAIDAKTTSKKTYPLTERNVALWIKNPGKYDLEGIDMKGQGAATGLKSLKTEDLKKLAKILKIKGRSSMNRPDLLRILKRKGITLAKTQVMKRPAKKRAKPFRMDWDKYNLYNLKDFATVHQIPGRSKMSREQLINYLRLFYQAKITKKMLGEGYSKHKTLANMWQNETHSILVAEGKAIEKLGNLGPFRKINRSIDLILVGARVTKPITSEKKLVMINGCFYNEVYVREARRILGAGATAKVSTMCGPLLFSNDRWQVAIWGLSFDEINEKKVKAIFKT
jgi:hypothetical protein